MDVVLYFAKQDLEALVVYPLKQGDCMIRLQAADCGGGRPEVANHEPGEGGQERVSVQRTENLKMDGMDGEAGENTDVTFYNPTHMCHSERPKVVQEREG